MRYMYTKTLCYLLELRTYLLNLFNYLIEKIIAVRSITTIIHDKCVSIYCRYIMLCLLINYKFFIISKIYDWCVKYIDIDVDKIQIVKTINYVDRYVIYNNKSGKMAISNVIKYLSDYESEMQKVTLPKNLIINCVFKNKETEYNLKNLFSKYATESIKNHTIGDIFLFNRNDVPIDTNNGELVVTKMKNGKIVTDRYDIVSVSGNTINYIYS